VLQIKITVLQPKFEPVPPFIR